MDTKTVMLTVLVSVDIATDNEIIAINEATRYVEGVINGADDGFLDGWNSQKSGPEILAIRCDIETDAEVEDATP